MYSKGWFTIHEQVVDVKKMVFPIYEGFLTLEIVGILETLFVMLGRCCVFFPTFLLCYINQHITRDDGNTLFGGEI